MKVADFRGIEDFSSNLKMWIELDLERLIIRLFSDDEISCARASLCTTN